jgi:ribonuclease E
MKDALKHDRARIQVGRISSFGLMEMSRQRLRTGVLEATTRQCPHCDGTGLVRTASSAGLSALRLIEDEAATGKGSVITLYASTEAAVYLLNAKRSDLANIEQLYSVSVEVIPEGEDEGAKMRVASSGPRNDNMPVFEPIVEEDEVEPVEDAAGEEEGEETADAGRRKRRKRRRGRGRDKREDGGEETAEASETAEQEAEAEEGGDGEEAPRKKRRRGGRRRKGRAERTEEMDGEQGDEAVKGEAAEKEAAEATEEQPAEIVAEEPAEAPEEEPAPASQTAEEEAAPVKPKRARRKKTPETDEQAEGEGGASQPAEAKDEGKPAKPARSRRKKVSEKKPGEQDTAETPAPGEAPAEPAGEETAEIVPLQASPESSPVADSPEEADNSPRRGWWQRTFGE